MKRWCLILLALFNWVSSVTAQVQSPEQFLGYPLGSHYTPHFNVVNYFRQVAEAAPNMVKVEQYGVTNEGRPLLLAYVSQPDNLGRLEAIRQNNLRLAGVAKDKMAPQTNAPALVWLSYNVHGNETSSSEAAMLTLFDLVNPSNNKTKTWLQNVVVIIDPCLNPDGRDRYVNWFNSVVGKIPNPQPFTREHSEPWPGGRSNHYYFDLNRDWAWQTQVETQQRMAKYNQWLPHVHVDFHEQGFNEPYYFAPAAEPYHEVITPWQRDFQQFIGRNNAKYFDENGWLFFTKERFDLFYPSYGDTYPMYKGAIGMTYEQGGHSRGGAAVINEDDDTLTLWDRLYHHYTTGMSTLEVTAQHQSQIVTEFKKYYDNARTTPPGEFKAWIIKTDSSDRMPRLQQLLSRNTIDWSWAESSSYSGLNYYTGKSESFKAVKGDLVINANQPHAHLLKVLFERTSRLSDSATYDITAWSLPYVFGLKTYGLNSYVTAVTKTPPASTLPTTPGSALAYAVRWNGLGSAKILAALLKKKIKVRYAEQPFTAGGQTFEKGTLLITRTSNAAAGTSLEKIVQAAADSAKESFYALPSGFVDKGFDLGSDKIRILRPPRVTLVSGDGISSLSVGEIWHLFDVQLQYPLNIVWGNELNRTVLNETDVLILPDGNHRILNERTTNEALKDWVNNGGRLIAMQDAVEQLSRNDWGVRLKNPEDKKEEKKEDSKKEDYSLLKRYENRERDFISGFNPGSIYKVILDNSHPLAFGYDETYFTLKQDDNIYEFFRENGWNVGVIKKEAQVSGFVGARLKEKLQDGWVFGVEDLGRGKVICMADNPLFRSFWENGKLLFCNAVFMVGQ